MPSTVISNYAPGSRVIEPDPPLGWQGAFVLEDLAEIAAINPAAAGRTADEMLSFVLRRVAKRPTEVFSAWDVDYGNGSFSGSL